MKKITRKFLSVILLVCLLFSFSVPAFAAENLKLPKVMRYSDGTEIAYQLNGTRLIIKPKDSMDGETVLPNGNEVLYPFLTTCSPEDQNILLALNYGISPIPVFALSRLVTSGKIKTINYFFTTYRFSTKNGKVTKITVDDGILTSPVTVDIKYKNGKFFSYFVDYGVDCESAKIQQDKFGLKFGETGDPYFTYTFNATLDHGNLKKVVKEGATSYGPYNETVLFSFAGNQVTQSVSDVDDGYSKTHTIQRYFYNPDGTLNSVDFQINEDQYDIDTKQTVESKRTDTYYSYQY